jgi:hypothetical protein
MARLLPPEETGPSGQGIGLNLLVARLRPAAGRVEAGLEAVGANLPIGTEGEKTNLRVGRIDGNAAIRSTTRRHASCGEARSRIVSTARWAPATG